MPRTPPRDPSRAGALVGRDPDLAALDRLLDRDDRRVVFVHGLAGLGKSALLARLAADRRAAGATVLEIDCRLVEPTERGVLSELARLGGEAVDALEDGIGFLARAGGPVLLLLDHYDAFLLMDTWLRREFAPALPDGCRLVVAGRRPPMRQWLTSSRLPGGAGVHPLAPLDDDDARRLLRDHGLDDPAAGELVRAAGGNPLALRLGAAALAGRAGATVREAAIQEVMQELAALYLADAPDPATRDALRSACVARRITRSLLRAFSLDEDATFEALRALPFVDARRDGLSLPDPVREAMARTVRAEDPERYHAGRRRVWRQLRSEIRAAPGSDMWRYTADLLFLIENPVVREAFFPSGGRTYAVEDARPGDGDAIRAIAADHDPRGAAALEAWWAARPDAFRVARDRDDAPAGFYVMLEADEVPASLAEVDPVTGAWLEHLEDDPPRPGGRCLLLRRWLAADAGEVPSPVQAACWLDVKRAYMALRPALQRVYLTVADVGPYAEVATRLGFQPLAIGPEGQVTASLDFGPGSVDGWIAGLVGRELGIRPGGLIDHDRRALDLDGETIALTPLEFGLIDHLSSLGGATATRDDLLERVWDRNAAATGSNVVDAVVRTLRRKLGAESGRLETVRGFGYRWRGE